MPDAKPSIDVGFCIDVIMSVPSLPVIHTMQALQIIEMLAGSDANGQPIVERLQVKVDENNLCELVKSPAFVKGLASGDVLRLNPKTEQYEIQQRSGNLCIRVFSKGDIHGLHEAITPELEKLGGELDLETPRMLVYHIHVSCGFDAIEAILNRHLTADSAWIYGNVYDPQDGSTPLNWWHDILKPQ